MNASSAVPCTANDIWRITMNGPTPSTGTGYNQTTWSCDNAAACHGNQADGHLLENSLWNVNFGNFGGAGGGADCGSVV